MIEPTEEMVEAFTDGSWEKPVWMGADFPNVRDGLAAVLAVVERDYALVDRKSADRPQCDSQRWGMRCDLPEGHYGSHSKTRFESWA